MLKRLELVGFKSFAEKTQFDFPAGVTAVVGPNGSGKSNVVDAVRWVLGEQSAKSLRGGEMVDVIFNGSASRRGLGMAEVTMTFDNTRRSLATDAEEVQITRRVYRSGEGEYLINHHPSRLRDIKDLFLGSGAGTDAYCIIEQGRVEALLQASTKERRTIFEEAAGISRFKAKKVETHRKLERVEQNLQRLRDIMDEVEKQLRSVKLQAAKAERYQEYSGRLKELRVSLSLQDYRQLDEQLGLATALLESLRGSLTEQSAQSENWDSEARRLEEALQRLEEGARSHEALLAGARQQIAAEETTLHHEWALTADLETDLARTRQQLGELGTRVASLADAAQHAAVELREAESQCTEQTQSTQQFEQELQAALVRLSELHLQVQADKANHLDQMRQSARLQNDVVSFKAQVDNLRREHERLRLRSAQAAEHLASIDLELQELKEADRALQARLANVRQASADLRQERDRLRHVLDETSTLLGDLRAQRSGLASRIEVLEGLERSHEGLGTGVREIFSQLETPTAGPWRTVVGMVADLLTVRREYAHLIDLALADAAQHFLVRDVRLIDDALRQRFQALPGRVSFLPLTPPTPILPPGAAEGAALHPGVIAPADQLVTCEDAGLAALPGQLLRNTWIVRDLAAARAIAAQTAGCRFVTLQGELLDADGTLTVGTYHAEAGLLSRKSELRDLREQATVLDRRLADTERELIDLRGRIVLQDSQADKLQEEIDVLAEQATDLRSRIGQHRERREGLHEEVQISRSEINGLEQEITTLDGSWRQAKGQAEAAERQVQALQLRLQQAEQEIREREQQRQHRQQACTTAKVALAQMAERLAGLRARHRQLDTDLNQRRQERVQGEQHLVAAAARLEESQRTMLQASATLARCYLDKETAERALTTLTSEREQKRQERQLLLERMQSSRSTWREQQQQVHTGELKVNDLRHQRDTLVDRLREDYQLDLAELAARSPARNSAIQSEVVGGASASLPPAEPAETGAIPTDEPRSTGPCDSTLDPNAANEEIAELRRKLSRLGSVNLDSLQELAELEARAGSLQVQYDDLTSAKRSLDEIIGKINTDSRRLFSETFHTIRIHFQELFRKLFGGGMADIVLEDENDVLDCGIEIVARPPGKELRSISLMSGGEKTLTAVALLLAIFRSKPSPFCILDEVDAALDEANVGRFTSVLRDFLDLSQFIVITHSKRTMSAADILYGVTMQESGVSKRVAVRFEDWPDDDRRPEVANGKQVAGPLEAAKSS